MGEWTASAERIIQYFEKPQGKITLGIDGIIDEVWQIISLRSSPDEYVLFEKMKDFAKSVYDCGEGGYANEIISKRRTYGGFTANTGKAIGRLGGTPTLLGMFGKDDGVDPVFGEFKDTYKLFTVGKAPVCQIFEFSDGKIMLPFIAERMDFNWNVLVNTVTWDKLREAFEDADMIGLGYWSSMPAFDEILSNICKHFLAGKNVRMFFDFADIRKRPKKALENTLQLLTRLNKQIPMTLSLNENEAELLCAYMGNTFSDDGAKALDAAAYIQETIDLNELIVHTPHFAVAATATEGKALVAQQHCKHPVMTTGAGDNFNGGYIMASLKSGALSLEERLFVGNAVTNFYVSKGYSPDKKDLEAVVRNYC